MSLECQTIRGLTRDGGGVDVHLAPDGHLDRIIGRGVVVILENLGGVWSLSVGDLICSLWSDGDPGDDETRTGATPMDYADWPAVVRALEGR